MNPIIDKNTDSLDAAKKIGEPVAVLTLRTVKSGCEGKFEALLHEFISRSLHDEDQAGVHVVCPNPVTGSREYGILHRFSSSESRDRFYQSPIFQEWELAVATLIEGEPKRQQLSGLETWFTLPGRKAVVPPPRWKMAMVTVLGVWPTSMLMTWLLGPLIGNMPLPLHALCVVAGMVTLLTWVVMPLLVKILNPWLQVTHKRSGSSQPG